VADARAQARGGEGKETDRWGREEREKEQSNGSTYKFKNVHFPGSKNHQIFMEAKSNHQEHNATTRAQKSVMDCSQKFKQHCSFQTFQEFYGSG
jgi:hypothetical protein